MKSIHNADKLALVTAMLVSANAYAAQSAQGDLKVAAARDSVTVARHTHRYEAAHPAPISDYHCPLAVSGAQQNAMGRFAQGLADKAILVGAGYVTGKAAEKCFAQGLRNWNQSTGVGALISPLLAWTVGLCAVAAGTAVAGKNIADTARVDKEIVEKVGLVSLAAIATFINEFQKESADVQADLVAMENALNSPNATDADKKKAAAAKMAMNSGKMTSK